MQGCFHLCQGFSLNYDDGCKKGTTLWQHEKGLKIIESSPLININCYFVAKNVSPQACGEFCELGDGSINSHAHLTQLKSFAGISRSVWWNFQFEKFRAFEKVLTTSNNHFIMLSLRDVFSALANEFEFAKRRKKTIMLLAVTRCSFASCSLVNIKTRFARRSDIEYIPIYVTIAAWKRQLLAAVDAKRRTIRNLLSYGRCIKLRPLQVSAKKRKEPL